MKKIKKKKIRFVLFIFIFISFLILLVNRVRQNRLQSQLVLEPQLPCEKFSEDVANECYQTLAIEKKDVSICDAITKFSQKTLCQETVLKQK